MVAVARAGREPCVAVGRACCGGNLYEVAAARPLAALHPIAPHPYIVRRCHPREVDLRRAHHRRRHPRRHAGWCRVHHRYQFADQAVALAQDVDLAIAAQGQTDVGAAAAVRDTVRIIAAGGVSSARKH